MQYTKRPWGFFIKFLSGRKFWLKFLWIKGRTSLQSHKNRDEWHLGLYKIKKGEIHRIQHGIFIELALGKPKENDIIRIEDDYDRI